MTKRRPDHIHTIMCCRMQNSRAYYMAGALVCAHRMTRKRLDRTPD